MAEDFEAKPAAIFAALFPEYSFNECCRAVFGFCGGRVHIRKIAPEGRAATEAEKETEGTQ